MSEAIRALIALDESADRDSLLGALPREPEVEVVAVLEGFSDGRGQLADSPANVLVVAVGGYSERALSFIEGSVRQQPDRPVVVLCDGAPNGFVRRVFQAGADDIVVLTGSDPAPSRTAEILFSLQKTVARKSGGRALAGAAGNLICVIGPKGGIGKTLTVVNLSVSLAQQGARVVVVDLDLQFGDVGLALGLSPDKTIYDLAMSGGSMDAEKVEAYLTIHSSGARVLLAPSRPDHAGAVGVEFLRELYSTLRSTNDYIVVDTPPGFSPEVIASIDSSTHVCMVGMLDSLSLKNTKLGLETLDLMDYDNGRVSLILNRADSHVGISHDDVVAIIGRQPDVFVPSHRDIARSINTGSPIVLSERRSEAAAAFHSLAEMYSNGNGAARKRSKRRRRGLLLGRRG